MMQLEIMTGGHLACILIYEYYTEASDFIMMLQQMIWFTVSPVK